MKVVPFGTFFREWSMTAVGIYCPLEPRRSLSMGCDFELRWIIDSQRFERQFPTQGGTVQLGKTPGLEAPTRHCDPRRPETRNFLEAAKPEQEIQEGVESAFLQRAAVPYFRVAPEISAVRQFEIAARLTARSGEQFRGTAGKDKQTVPVRCGQLDPGLQMRYEEGGLVHLKRLEEPG